MGAFGALKTVWQSLLCPRNHIPGHETHFAGVLDKAARALALKTQQLTGSEHNPLHFVVTAPEFHSSFFPECLACLDADKVSVKGPGQFTDGSSVLAESQMI